MMTVSALTVALLATAAFGPVLDTSFSYEEYFAGLRAQAKIQIPFDLRAPYNPCRKINATETMISVSPGNVVRMM